MNTLTYRFSLDTHKNGIQRTLQGFQTGENVTRAMEISLKEAAEPYELPLANLTASMYVLKPGQSSPSINSCTIDGERNLIKYTVSDDDIDTAGVVEMQLKLINNGEVLISPKFGMEVWESNIEDEAAEQTTTYTSLTEALAAAEAMKDSAIADLYIDDNNVFTVVFGDGTTYTNDAVAQAIARIDSVETYSLKSEGYAVGKQSGADVGSDSPYYHNNAKYFSNQASSDASTATSMAGTAQTKATLSESYAKGGTGTRIGENTDNAKYYMESCLAIAASLAGGGLIPIATITFENLPTENLITGMMYNISDAFTSDSRFKDGSGIGYGAGTNVYYTADGKWDVLAGTSITINSKTGASITLVASDIPLTGYEKPSSTSAIATTDTIAQALGKIEKALDGKVANDGAKVLSDNNYSNADKAAVDKLNGFDFGGVMTEPDFQAGIPHGDTKIRFTYKPTSTT